MKIPDEWFENRAEQLRIKEDVAQSIPTDVYYHNLIIAFAEMLADFTREAFKEAIYSKSTKRMEKE